MINALVESYRTATDMNNKQFTSYRLTVKQGDLEWFVIKRYSDFHTLHQTLLDQDPQEMGCIPLDELPRLPPKQFTPGRSLSDDVVSERKVRLGEYLSALTCHPQALCNVHLLSFLGIISTSRQIDVEKRSRPVIHISRMNETVEWGDLILFKCRNTLSGLQRKVTGAEFDHVGIIVPSSTPSGGPSTVSFELLESTGEGVTSYPLIGRLMAYSNHSFTKIMCLRRLRGRGDIPVDQLDNRKQWLVDFKERVEGAPYGFSVKKMIGGGNKRKSSRMTNGSLDEEDSERLVFSKTKGEDTVIVFDDDTRSSDGGEGDEEENFFCSELVAACLMEVGLLHTDKEPASFWPGAFAENDSIDESVEAPFHFSSEIAIDCRMMEVGKAVSEADKAKRRERLLRKRRNTHKKAKSMLVGSDGTSPPRDELIHHVKT